MTLTATLHLWKWSWDSLYYWCDELCSLISNFDITSHSLNRSQLAMVKNLFLKILSMYLFILKKIEIVSRTGQGENWSQEPYLSVSHECQESGSEVQPLVSNLLSRKRCWHSDWLKLLCHSTNLCGYFFGAFLFSFPILC